jgi:hypothetical protein
MGSEEQPQILRLAVLAQNDMITPNIKAVSGAKFPSLKIGTWGIHVLGTALPPNQYTPPGIDLRFLYLL